MKLIDLVSLESSVSYARAKALALIVDRSELQQTLQRSLGKDKILVDELIEFLSLRPKRSKEKGHRGLWSAPIVPVPGEEKFVLLLPALKTSNPLRKTEAWIEKGGLSDYLSNSARGSKFELNFRNQVTEKLSENTLFFRVKCARFAIKKTSAFGEEVDLLFKVGSLLVVGEIKFHLTPADSFERYEHFSKLKSASEQARRKSDLLTSRPDVVALALGITLEEARDLHPIPLVIENQGFGLTLSVDGCLVTESSFLLTCLASASIVTGMSFDVTNGSRVEQSTQLYKDQKDFEDKFSDMLSNPLILRRFIDRSAGDVQNFRRHRAFLLVLRFRF